MSYFFIVGAMLFGLLVGGGVVAMLYERHQLLRKTERLEQDMLRDRNELLKRIEQLDQAGKRRLPYRSAEEIEHGLAALDVFIREFEFEKSVLDNAIAHFQKARGADS